ncbi:acetolactate synthase small subunit [uncultured Sphaerochaeta sp.]|uniref:acetolactate synthase small subunit n=1 Tax=uncultured Sphaerochaeta sp. TaxID=886478 RepID=UPI002A0A4876|nr:acetolactate synthase small subunit [uncultured Sphaerochaeta sp.]
MHNSEERYTLAILVNNHAGVLMRVVSLFSRRGYNIDCLSVGETENEAFSRITIVVSGDRAVVDQIKKQVGKLVDVKRVYEMAQTKSLQRELVMVKVSTKDTLRTQVVELAEIFKAKIIDVTASTVTLEMTGSLDKIQSFLDLMLPYGIVEMARTGITALERGARPLSEISFSEDDN